MNDHAAAPEDAQVAVTLSTMCYLHSKEAMQRALANPALPTADRWRLIWGPVTVEENLSYIVEGPVIGSGPARQYAYAVRGTVMEPWNLIEDVLDSLGLETPPWNASPGVKISEGMKIGWHNLTASRDDGRTALEVLRGIPTGSELIVTGHSLGAMLASVMSLYFDSELSPRIRVVPYTFAAPTAGNEAFAQAYLDSFGGAGRYYNCLDLVPKGYNHDDLESIKSLFPCDGTPTCGDLFSCRHLIDGAQHIAGHRYFHPPDGTRLQAKAYGEPSNSLRHFFAEALNQHHATHYMWMLGIPLEAIHVLGPSWAPPEIPCPCAD